MSDHALDSSSVELFRCLVRGWMFDARGAYVLYIVAVIALAAGWLIMKAMVKERRAEG